ncbi:6-carboxytetrahydropterin synthase [Thalassotalea piscium]|uniref:6-carboxy-5,6,7,8-tetrahydropterin synthase n=1 Tax=Thalassotalea piscium TaxID=1230533 RepID=A0A7X0NFB4_9GAMM|nr:6-carboxytetrahydropterin synthase [Thalassotalea piscium]MBB6542380.1 6-pyruvoyl-tetrahydropterin synthase [Thalassotalea piscium]
MQLFVDDLTVIDFSYACPNRGIVGESWIVDVLLKGDLNEQSMVLDFGVVKKQIKAIIDAAVDHKLLLPILCESVTATTSKHRDGHEYIDITSKVGNYFLHSPSCAFAHINDKKITIKSVTEHLTNIIFAELPKNVQGLVLKLRAEVIPSDFYHYTHGLKLHDGNCQRIAHGHRSKIKLYENDKRSETLEHFWCQRWEDIYIASESDRVAKESIELSPNAMQSLTDNHQYFAYHAPQGRFDIAVPSNKLEVVDCDSTVELLADYIARQLKKAKPENSYQVVAYEGVAKGAIANV